MELLEVFEFVVENYNQNLEAIDSFNVDYVMSCNDSISLDDARIMVEVFNHWSDCEDKNQNNYFYIVENVLNEC